MHITHCQIYLVEIKQTAPLAPYRSHIRSTDTTTKAIVELTTDTGIVGWGEHNQNFLDGINIKDQNINATAFINGWDPYNIEQFHLENPFGTRLRCGEEMSMWDIIG